ncbi:hypothetical protein RJ639_018780 [Escallonia herrerae]|uniref:LETM1-like protein n=1 Tax=Escallonia herrerae TaxID=1293975 RepID=A0AA88V7E2_9ASTE|nr:hypothetical protein RJ639_018780 [Escallonia herrerae]
MSVRLHHQTFLSSRLVGFRIQCLTIHKLKRMGHLLPFASTDDGVAVNGSPQASTSGNVQDMRVKLDQSLGGEDYNVGLVQSLHDAARVFELAIKEQVSLSKTSWFSTAWLGVDKNAWVKALSYQLAKDIKSFQASVYSFLQAASEISSRGDGRDRDINVFVQRSLMRRNPLAIFMGFLARACMMDENVLNPASLLRQSAPVESIIREKLSAKQPEVSHWFWTEQVPAAVTSFVNYFEEDQRFSAATVASGIGTSSGNASDKSLLMLALTCIATITKLGPAKVSCAPFFSIIPDITGRLMDMLVELMPIRQAYHSMKDIGLRREFLVHFGPRAGACRVTNDGGGEEVAFWVGLVQKQLQRAIDRERVWSRLTTCESIEVLEKDLAIFGFFIALGRSTQSFLSANKFETVDEPIEGLIRNLIGGSVLYYPQLSSISSYQLYVEVVCEELDWLCFYPRNSDTSKSSHGHRTKQEGPPNAEAIPLVLDVCSHWIQSFIKYSKWLENPSNVKAARFVSRGYQIIGNTAWKSVERTGSGTYAPSENDPDSFDKALESVEEALIKLEELLQDLHVSSSSTGKEHLKAACSDLERIRKLKKEAEFLEASFRAKADSLQQIVILS